MRRVLETHLPTGSTGVPEERLMHIVDCVINRAPRRSRNACLARGVTAYRLLRARGCNVHLVFGARMVGTNLEAHCWLSDGIDAIYEPDNPGAAFDEMFRITPDGVAFAQ
jgi:hypothetical protein